ncbi:hypothetical protein HJ581_0001445 (plasmid) [Rhodococcus opacus]|nr:hypothetical protein [Rhodococcus opacus]WKN52611.1 hypothetical protein HJ581_0001445 [Rhodococcus opacus]
MIGSKTAAHPDLEGVNRAAQRMVEAHELDFGFDIHALCNEYADVDYITIPSDLDAILFGLVGEPRLSRPHIALNAARIGDPANLADHQRRRLRYTIAHELGHIELSWHSGLSFCKEGGESDPERESSEFPPSETEAHLFAQRILVPSGRLSQLLELRSQAEVLEVLNVADVHFSVALRSLVEVLPPGHILAAVKGTTVERSYRSRKTPISPPLWRSSLKASPLDKLSEERVIGRVGGRRIYWWTLPSSERLEDVGGDVYAKDIIRSILDSLDLEVDEVRSLRASIAGKESTIFGWIRSGDLWPNPEVIAARITQKVGADRKLERIFAHPDFRVYVSARAAEIASEGWDEGD